MSRNILCDPRIRLVDWRDLLQLNKWEMIRELTWSLPWLALSLYLAEERWLLPAAGASAVFFMAALRQGHDAFHSALGLSRRANDWFQVLLSAVMLGSLHAFQFNHMRHHKHCLGDEDWEASCARQKWWQVLILGPLFPLRLHWHAIRLAKARQRRWIAAELSANFFVLFVSFVVCDVFVLKFHYITMALGHSITAFFTAWTVHHDCDPEHTIARTQRGQLCNRLTMNLFFHAEHHLFPRVPTCNLPQLAERLDQRVPELVKKVVF